MQRRVQWIAAGRGGLDGPIGDDLLDVGPALHERIAQIGRCRIGPCQHDALLSHIAEAVGDRNGQVVAWHMVHPDRGRAQGVRCGGTDRGDAKAVRQRMAVR